MICNYFLSKLIVLIHNKFLFANKIRNVFFYIIVEDVKFFGIISKKQRKGFILF